MPLYNRLQVLICTYGRGVEKIDPAGLPCLEGVDYLVSCQNPAGEKLDTTKLDKRKDIEIVYSDSRGLSNNRNHAIAHSSSEYLMIADDDLSLSAEGLKAIMAAFDADPELGMLTFRSVRPEALVYPPDGHDLSRPWRGYVPVSFEIAVRRSALLSSGVRFSPLAGIGAPYLCAGEEDLFVHHFLKSTRGRFADFVVATHDGNTTGFRRQSERPMLRTKGAVVCRTQNFIRGLVRLPLLARRAPAPAGKALLWMFQGYLYALKNYRRL